MQLPVLLVRAPFAFEVWSSAFPLTSLPEVVSVWAALPSIIARVSTFASVIAASAVSASVEPEPPAVPASA